MRTLSRNTTARRIALAGTAALALAGGALATAPTANAASHHRVNSKACMYAARYDDDVEYNGTMLRRGPSTHYIADYQLAAETPVYVACTRGGYRHGWSYVKVLGHKKAAGKKGWIKTSLLYGQVNLD